MILVNLVDLLTAKDTGRVEVTLGHHDVSVGLDDVERALLDERNHFFTEVQLQRLKVRPLVVVKVLLDNTSERGRELEVRAFGCVDAVAFSQLPDEHGRQIVLIASQQHVPRCGDTGLEVVGHRGVFTGAQCLEPVVPPRNKGRLL